MALNTDAIVLGFAKTPLLIERSFAPLRRLHHQGILRNIHYVTWDSPDLDPFVEPVLTMPEVTITRVPAPLVQGTPAQKNLAYQTHNLDAALSLVADDDTLVLKYRPDVIAKAEFLRAKIERLSGPQGEILTSASGMAMPKPAFDRKVWLPWADSNQPFFYEDAVFLGLKRDLRKFVIPLTRNDLDVIAVPECSHYVHIVRFANAFLSSWPLFRDYLRNFRHIASDMDYRVKFISHVVNGPFFLFLVIAHAWILHSHFHVDSGETGDIRFYPNTRNVQTNWADPTTWVQATPYDRLEEWRTGERPGEMFPNISRPFGRLITDRWQDALFKGELSDFPRETLTALLQHTASCSDGRLQELEATFYQDLEQFYFNYMLAHQPTRAAVNSLMAAAVGRG